MAQRFVWFGRVARGRGATIRAAGLFLGRYPDAGHAIVLTGVRPFPLYNDPWEPKAKPRPWQWVNARLLELPNALLAKDTKAS